MCPTTTKNFSEIFLMVIGADEIIELLLTESQNGPGWRGPVWVIWHSCWRRLILGHMAQDPIQALLEYVPHLIDKSLPSAVKHVLPVCLSWQSFTIRNKERITAGLLNPKRVISPPFPPSILLFWIYISVTQEIKYLTVLTMQREILNSMLIWIFWWYFRRCLAVLSENKYHTYSTVLETEFLCIAEIKLCYMLDLFCRNQS